MADATHTRGQRKKAIANEAALEPARDSDDLTETTEDEYNKQLGMGYVDRACFAGTAGVQICQ